MIRNRELALFFEKLASMLSLQNANPFRIRAYRNAANTVLRWPEELGSYFERWGKLPKMPGIASDLSSKLMELIQTGHLGLLEQLEKSIPSSLLDLLDLEGLGPHRVTQIWKQLGVTTMEGLQLAASQGLIKRIPGFGPVLEKRILDLLNSRVGKPIRHSQWVAEDLFLNLKNEFEKKNVPCMLLPAGSLRRGRDTVGDVDVLALTRSRKRVLQVFREFSKESVVIASGIEKITIRTPEKIQLDLRIVDEESAGAAWIYFTGSKSHNIALRKIAIQQGWKLNEYGLYQGDQKIAGKTEDEVYRQLGLDWIPPEIREDQGEIEAAQEHRLPHLIENHLLVGDLHMHTMASDGHDSILSMAEAAIKKGYSYIAITDHSRKLRVANGLDRKKLLLQYRQIDRLNQQLFPFRILKGVEVDILKDGSLDLDDLILKKADVVVASIHDHFGLGRKEQTDRLLKAMEHPHFHILGHPSTRLIGKRESIDFDFDRICQVAVQYGIALELNAQPDRLDLNGEQVRIAKKAGVLFSIATDAHSVTELNWMRFGIQQARRGWIEKKEVLNAFPLDQLLKHLQKRLP
jgi:DNA polymerase (family 10)